MSKGTFWLMKVPSSLHIHPQVRILPDEVAQMTEEPLASSKTMVSLSARYVFAIES